MKTLYRLGLYIAYKTDSIINADTTIANFADTFKNSVYGQLLDLNMSQYSGMSPKTADSLWDRNDSIVSIDSISDILKTVNGYLFSKVAIGDSLNSTDVSELSVIALLCPFRCGTGVYGARAIVEALDTMNTHFYNCCELQTDDCGEYRLEGKEPSTNNCSSKRFAIYPNPTSGEFIVEYKFEDFVEHKLIVQDITGKVLLKRTLQNNEGVLRVETSNLSNGIYFVKLVSDRITNYQGKLCILR